MRTNHRVSLTLVLSLGLAACAADDDKDGLIGNHGQNDDAGRDLGGLGPHTGGTPDAGLDADVGPNADVVPGSDSGGSPDTAPDGGGDTGSEPDGGLGDDPGEEPDPGDEPDPLEPGLLGFIGSACESVADCEYADAICLFEDDGYPLGMCTEPCDRLCPDLASYPTTFCTESDADGIGPVCHSRCDFGAYPGTGCRDGYRCDERPRAGEPATLVGTCVPGDALADLSPCLTWLVEHGVPFEPTTYAPRHPADRTDLTCTVEDPVLLQSPVNNINLRYYYDDPGYFRPMLMSCHLARSIYEMTEVLHTWDVTEVLHIGTTVCRTISGTNTLSQHAYGLALDIAGFFDSEVRWYGVEDHWEHDTDDPVSLEASVLLEFVEQLYLDWIFNIILTPNYNAAHDNHFHVDLTDGAHGLYARDELPGPFLGVNPHGD